MYGPNGDGPVLQLLAVLLQFVLDSFNAVIPQQPMAAVNPITQKIHRPAITPVYWEYLGFTIGL